MENSVNPFFYVTLIHLITTMQKILATELYLLSVSVSSFRSLCLHGNNAAVTDIECLNCWNAVRAVAAARHYIARIQGQPINTVSTTIYIILFTFKHL